MGGVGGRKKVVIVSICKIFFWLFIGVANSATWDPTLGWDFECHTYSHPYLTQLSDNQIRWEMEQVNAAFIAHGYSSPRHHAYPYGDFDGRVENILKEYRDTAWIAGGNTETYPVQNWYEIKAAPLEKTTQWNEVKTWIDSSIANKGLLIIFTHDVSENPGDGGCTPAMLETILSYLYQKRADGQLVVSTISGAYDNWSTHPPDKATIVLSFDDSYSSDYTTVYPLFKEYGMKGTSFIIASAIGVWPGALTWEQIETMRTEQTTPIPIPIPTPTKPTPKFDLIVVIIIGVTIAIYLWKRKF